MTNSIGELEKDARCIFVIGSNPTDNHPVIGMKIKKNVLYNGAKLIVADARYTDLASIADIKGNESDAIELYEKAISIAPEHTAAMNHTIANNLTRGATVLKAQGGYTAAEKDVIFCACSRSQLPRLHSLVREIEDAVMFFVPS